MSVHKVLFLNGCDCILATLIIWPLSYPFQLGSSVRLVSSVIFHLFNIYRVMITGGWCWETGLVIIVFSHSLKRNKLHWFCIWQHNARLSGLPLFPDHHLPSATLLLVWPHCSFSCHCFSANLFLLFQCTLYFPGANFSTQPCRNEWGWEAERDRVGCCVILRVTVACVSWCQNTCSSRGLEVPEPLNTGSFISLGLTECLWTYKSSSRLESFSKMLSCC